jgi:hypothetical protein
MRGSDVGCGNYPLWGTLHYFRFFARTFLIAQQRWLEFAVLHLPSVIRPKTPEVPQLFDK